MWYSCCLWRIHTHAHSFITYINKKLWNRRTVNISRALLYMYNESVYILLCCRLDFESALFVKDCENNNNNYSFTTRTDIIHIIQHIHNVLPHTLSYYRVRMSTCACVCACKIVRMWVHTPTVYKYYVCIVLPEAHSSAVGWQSGGV